MARAVVKRSVIGRYRSLPRPWIRHRVKNIPNGYRDLHSARSGLQLIKPTVADDASQRFFYLSLKETEGRSDGGRADDLRPVDYGIVGYCSCADGAWVSTRSIPDFYLFPRSFLLVLLIRKGCLRRR